MRCDDCIQIVVGKGVVDALARHHAAQLQHDEIVPHQPEPLAVEGPHMPTHTPSGGKVEIALGRSDGVAEVTDFMPVTGSRATGHHRP